MRVENYGLLKTEVGLKDFSNNFSNIQLIVSAMAALKKIAGF
jgi:hypothetical protein